MSTVTDHPAEGRGDDPTDVVQAEAFEAKEIGGDHYRSSAVFLTQSHPRQTEGADLHVGTSLDQIYAQQFGQQTPIPSMQLCIENVDQAGQTNPNGVEAFESVTADQDSPVVANLRRAGAIIVERKFTAGYHR